MIHCPTKTFSNKVSIPICLKMFFKVVIVLAFLSSTFALDEKVFQELTCDQVVLGKQGKWNWEVEMETMYAPMFNKLARIRTASVLLKKPVSELTEDDVAGNSCIVYGKDDTIFAFGSQTNSSIITQYNEDGFNYTFGDYTAQFHLLATDNKSYFLGYNCWQDGQATWGITTTTPEISPELEEKVLKRIEAAGFRKSFAVKETYEGCESCDLDKQ